MAVAALTATSAMAVISTFQTGEFFTADGPVARGAFGGDVWIRNLTIGQRTLTAVDGAIGNASAVRIYAAPAGTNDFTLIPDDSIGKPGIPVGFAVGRDVESADIGTALEALTGFSLSRMLLVNGNERVRIDMIASAPQRDSDPDNDDPDPEALIAGSLKNATFTMTPIVGGEIDAPVLGTAVTVPAARTAEGETGLSILMRGSDTPFPISVVGLDLSGDFSVSSDKKLVGFRIEIEPGSPAVIKGWFTGVNADVMPSQFEEDSFTPVLAGALSDGGSSGSGFAFGGTQETSGYNPGLYGGSGAFAGSGGAAPPIIPTNFNNGGGNGGGGSGGGGGGGGVTPPPPPIPSPGPLAILAMALGLSASRRRK